jgi:predicted DNA-binding transcriptional regulator YafY
MSQLPKALLLLNLLANRSSVSVKTIQDICNMSRRSVFRYVRALSEANLPIVFDRAARGYRLLEEVKFPSDMTCAEITLLMCVLCEARRHTNREYAGQIDELIEKIGSRQPRDVRVILGNDTATSEVSLSDISNSLTSNLIKVAAEHRIPVSLTTQDGGNQFVRLLLSNVSVTFDQTWKVKGSSQQREVQIPLEKVLAAELSCGSWRLR